MQNAKTKFIIWGISPWAHLWSMGEHQGYAGFYQVLKALINAGHEIQLFSLNDGTSKAEETYEGIHIHRFKVPMERSIRAVQIRLGRIKYLGLIGTNLFQFLYLSLYTLSVIKRAGKDGKKARPSLIYAYSAYDAPAAYILSRLYHIPNITKLFGTFITSQALSSPLRLSLKWQEVLAFKLPCKYLIILNDGTQGDKVAQRLGVPAERLKFWRDGVKQEMRDPDFDSDKFKEEQGLEPFLRVILAVSRLAGWKRLERLINAVPSVVSEYKNVVFLIVGDGPERENLERLSRSSGVNKYVRFVSAVTHEKVADYMNAADIFVSVNDLSNVSNGLLEAMVYSKCIVTLDNGDTGELIQDNQTGKLIRIGNEDEIVAGLSKTIIDVLEDDGLRARLGKNARIYAQEHFQTWGERTTMEVRLIEKLVGKGHG